MDLGRGPRSLAHPNKGSSSACLDRLTPGADAGFMRMQESNACCGVSSFDAMKMGFVQGAVPEYSEFEAGNDIEVRLGRVKGVYDVIRLGKAANFSRKVVNKPFGISALPTSELDDGPPVGLDLSSEIGKLCVSRFPLSQDVKASRKVLTSASLSRQVHQPGGIRSVGSRASPQLRCLREDLTTSCRTALLPLPPCISLG